MSLDERTLRSEAQYLRKTTALTYTQLLSNNNNQFDRHESSEVFLIHDTLDEELLLGVKLLLEYHGLTVRVDVAPATIQGDYQPDQQRVEPLAHLLQYARTLLYIHIEGTPVSNWADWKLAYMDTIAPTKTAIIALPSPNHTPNTSNVASHLAKYPLVEERDGGLYVAEATALSFIEWLQRDIPDNNLTFG